MNMKRVANIVSMILTITMILMILSTVVMAAPSDIIADIKPDYTDDNTGIGELGKNITNIIGIIGVVISVIVLLIIGIKYMIGSASEKAEYKKTMIPYLVGALLVFGASTIATVVVNMASGITTGS